MSNWQTAKAKPISKLKLSNAELTKLRPEASCELFKQEFTNMPECLVDKDGDPFHGVKSEILKVIAPKENALEDGVFKEADGLVFDISVEIRSETAVLNTAEYTYTDFAVHLLRRLEKNAMQLKAKRLDIVFDYYQEHGIKNITHASRGTGVSYNLKLVIVCQMGNRWSSF